jgi:hypothetical protein
MMHGEVDVAPCHAGDLGYQAVQAIPGVGPVLAVVFVAEIGDISRFKDARVWRTGPRRNMSSRSPLSVAADVSPQKRWSK